MSKPHSANINHYDSHITITFTINHDKANGDDDGNNDNGSNRDDYRG